MTDQTVVQPVLLPIDLAQFKDVMLNLDKLPKDEYLASKPVTNDFLQDIQMRGIITPIIVADVPNHGLFVVAGCRRIKAARKLGFGQIKAMRGKMGYREAMMARSAENNQRSDNGLANIQSIQNVLENDPTASIKDISIQTGINQAKVKSLMKISQLPKILIDGVTKGQVAEETLRKLSTMNKRYVDEAVTIFLQNKDRVAQAKVDGKIYQKEPVLLSMEHVVELQRVRVNDTLSMALPNMPALPEVPKEKYLVIREDNFLYDIYDTLSDAQLYAVTMRGSTIWRATKL